VSSGKKVLIKSLRKVGFIAVLVLLGLVMLGALGSVVQTVFMKMEHPEKVDPGADTKQ
jgi:ABC-type Na+ efflux pump permease subunit